MPSCPKETGAELTSSKAALGHSASPANGARKNKAMIALTSLANEPYQYYRPQTDLARPALPTRNLNGPKRSKSKGATAAADMLQNPEQQTADHTVLP